ncbi:DEAD-box ATP-dependent RNA helicase 52A-like [Fagus crenata]
MDDPTKILDDLLNSSLNLSNLDHAIQLEDNTTAAKHVEMPRLAGKIIADRAINKNKVKAVLSKAWRLAKGVSITPKGENLFLFQFLAEGDRRKVKAFSRSLKSIKTAIVVGGTNIADQRSELKAGVDMVVATPGRFIDHLQLGNTSLSRVLFVVLDEADRMLNMGFEPQIREVLAEEGKAKAIAL